MSFGMTRSSVKISLHFALCALAAVVAGAQDSATLEGTVHDAQGRPLSAATVYLHLKSTSEARTARTDPAGGYRFSGLRAGEYLLRADAGASGEAPARSVTLADRETKKVDLTIDYALFDEPNFIVAGVTDSVQRGGHGSDAVLRSSEALAKAAASLADGGAPTSGSAASRHHALAYAAENRGDALEAAREYQQAAELEPSEPNLFDWGTELLMHRAAEQATAVFARGHRLYPRSVRLLLALAAAWYARGNYERAAHGFFEACDLNPGDPVAYMFLAKVQAGEITQLPGYQERLRRFVELQPGNAWANYYYAVNLWRQRPEPGDAETVPRALELLEKAIRLDPTLALAYLEMGIVYSDRNDIVRAIAAYQKAIEVSPRLEEAHYRLGQAYGRTGQKEKARQELETYQQLSKMQQQEIERRRGEIRQFVFELRDTHPAAPPR